MNIVVILIYSTYVFQKLGQGLPNFIHIALKHIFCPVVPSFVLIALSLQKHMLSFSVLDKFARGYSLNPIGLRDEKLIYDAFTSFQNLALFMCVQEDYLERIWQFCRVLIRATCVCKQFSNNIWWTEGNL